MSTPIYTFARGLVKTSYILNPDEEIEYAKKKDLTINYFDK